MQRVRIAVGAIFVLLNGCLEHDNVLHDVAPVIDSVAIAVARGPGTSGKLLHLLDGSWKSVAVLDAQSPASQVASLVGEEGAKEFGEVVNSGTSGTVLVFQYMHGSTQAVFIPQSRATFAPEMLGHSFSQYALFTIDSVGRFVARPDF